MHTAAATGVFVLVATLLGPGALWAATLIPLVGWSRLRLRRHTLAQVVGGMLCGALVFGLFFALPTMRGNTF